MSHALLAPSSASTWVKCPGSVILRATGGIETGSPEAEDGQAAHHLCEITAQAISDNGADMELAYAGADSCVGTSAPNGVIITQEMAEAAKLYVDVLNEYHAFHANALNLEEHLDVPDIHQECNGTPDANWAYNETDGTLHLVVADFKFGHGIVEAFENWQMMCYASGLLTKYGIDGYKDQHTKVTMIIVQPRSFHAEGPVRKWEVTASDLRGYFNQLRSAADEALGNDPTVKSGLQCRYCLGRHACESARQAAVKAVEILNVATPTPLTNEALAVELPALDNAMKQLQYRRDALLEEAENRIGQGQNIPGLARQPIKGQRKWDGELKSVLALGKMVGADLQKDPEPVTPAEAERRLKKRGLSAKDAAAMVAPMTTRPSSGFKVVIDDGSKARKTFTQ